MLDFRPKKNVRMALSLFTFHFSLKKRFLFGEKGASKQNKYEDFFSDMNKNH